MLGEIIALGVVWGGYYMLRGSAWTRVWATSFLEDGSINKRGVRRPDKIATKGYWGNYTMRRGDVLAALPAHVALGRLIDVRYPKTGRVVTMPVYDIGPHNGSRGKVDGRYPYDDPYWETGSRPQAETGIDLIGRKTNLAGLDLSLAAWEALGVPSARVDTREFSDYAEWRFH